MKDVLIISPRFPPANAADAHRVRLSLPFYRAFGWNPIVLTTEDTSSSIYDSMLLDSIPEEVEIIRVPIWRERTTRRLGFGQIDYRSFLPLLKAGADLIKKRKIPVVLFSNTAFLTFALGPIWKKRFGCKIVYDFQDPWYQGENFPYTRANAPGSWRRYLVTQAIARRLEPFSLRAADHVLSVSQGYIDTLKVRHAFFRETACTVLPFPASELDYQYVAERGIQQSIFARDGRKHWVYAGRGGPDMEKALVALFSHIRSLKDKDPTLASKLRLHFVGTSYAPAGRTSKSVEPVARRFGLEDIVFESAGRIPYFEALALYRDSDAVILIGSDSADYTASKLFNCVLSGKPVLAVFHARSLVASIAKELPCVYMANFENGETPDLLQSRIADQHRRLLEGPLTPCPMKQISPWLAEASTEKQCCVFDSVVAR